LLRDFEVVASEREPSGGIETCIDRGQLKQARPVALCGGLKSLGSLSI